MWESLLTEQKKEIAGIVVGWQAGRRTSSPEDSAADKPMQEAADDEPAPPSSRPMPASPRARSGLTTPTWCWKSIRPRSGRRRPTRCTTSASSTSTGARRSNSPPARASWRMWTWTSRRRYSYLPCRPRHAPRAMPAPRPVGGERSRLREDRRGDGGI